MLGGAAVGDNAAVGDSTDVGAGDGAAAGAGEGGGVSEELVVLVVAASDFSWVCRGVVGAAGVYS